MNRPDAPSIETELIIDNRNHVLALFALLSVLNTACGPRRLAVVGPMSGVDAAAARLETSTSLGEPTRIDFTWELNEAGSRMSGQGVARIEAPYHARLDLFLDNGETVIAAALVGDDLRLPPGSPDDVLPPVDLMWGTLGVFRPLAGTRLVGGDRLEGASQRLRYRYDDGRELHYEIEAGEVRALELLDRESVVQWVRLSADSEERYPRSATYRNLVEFRELTITRESVRTAPSFDSAIWDPR